MNKYKKFFVLFAVVFAAVLLERGGHFQNLASVLEADEIYYYDVRVILSWDSTYCSMDLYVREPTGETASCWNPRTSAGGEIGYYDSEEMWHPGDSEDNLAPEVYRLREGAQGVYEIRVYYPGDISKDVVKARIFVTMHEGTPGVEFRQFSKDFGSGEQWWSAGSFTFNALPGSGSCFVATAAYNSPIAEEVQILSTLRDRYLLTNGVGRTLVCLYEKTSPPFARLISKNMCLKKIVRMELAPLLRIGKILLREN